MKDQILYVELKSGYNDNGPAWIGRGVRSKSGRTLYFNGKVFRSIGGRGVQGNHFDIESGEEYWISGVKKDKTDRHWAGSGAVMIDEAVVADYLTFTGSSTLDPNRFKTVQLDHSDVAVRNHVQENKAME